MTNCRNCGAPIDIYTDKCPYCDTPYEAPGGSETGEKVEEVVTELTDGYLIVDRFDSDFNEQKFLIPWRMLIGAGLALMTIIPTIIPKIITIWS